MKIRVVMWLVHVAISTAIYHENPSRASDVFHVCAFTDDGMVMKSFLCPESTLFDQSILKCNWWFYVDCKSSRKLYDSNIPISKSYQLMKALAFFSAYTNQTENATS